MRRKRKPPKPRKPALTLRNTIHAAPVNVWREDWPKVHLGLKSELRFYGRSLIKAPRPIVLYSTHPDTGELSTALAVLEAAWQEPLGAITAESLEREGYPDLDSFRRYIKRRYPQTGFRPLTVVQVYRVRLWRDSDVADQGEWALRQLYGELLP